MGPNYIYILQQEAKQRAEVEANKGGVKSTAASEQGDLARVFKK